MKKRFLAGIVVAVLMVSSLAGCGSSTGSAPAVTTVAASETEANETQGEETAAVASEEIPLLTCQKEQLKAYDFDLSVLGDSPATKLDTSVGNGDFVIGFSNSFSGNSWRQQFEKEFEVVADSYKTAGYISDYIMLDAGNDQTKQIADIEDLITQGVDAIVVNAITDVALNDVLEEAMNEGILVFNADNLVSVDVTSKIIVKDYDLCFEAGAWMGETLGGNGGKLVVLDGTAGSSTDTNRHDGMIDGMVSTNPTAEVVVQANADWDYAAASTAMGTILSSQPEIDGVLSQGGAMTMAAMDAFIAAGRDLVPMTGEASNGFLRMWAQHMEEGFSSNAFANPCFQSVMCLNLAVNALNGVKVEPQYQLNMPAITDDLIDELYDPDLSDSFWVFSVLSEDQVKELFAE